MRNEIHLNAQNVVVHVWTAPDADSPETCNVLFQLNASNKPDEPKKNHVDICFVVNISHYVEFESNQSVLKPFILTATAMLDTMTEKDRVSIISFGESAEVLFPMIFMDEENKLKAKEVLQNLPVVEHETNLWGGLCCALNEFKTTNLANHAGRISAVFLLTDGNQNIGLQDDQSLEDLLCEEKRKWDESENMFPMINTFGFGYSLDSKLLHDVALIGEGHFTYIPDFGCVASAFSHSFAALYTTFATKTSLTIETRNGTSLEIGGEGIPGGFCYVGGDKEMNIEVGSILHGQSRDIVIPMKIPQELRSGFNPYAEVTVKYKPVAEATRKSDSLFVYFCKPVYKLDVMSQLHRLEVASLLKKISSAESGRPLDHLRESLYKVNTLIHRMENTISNCDCNLETRRENPKYRAEQLLKDLKGEVLGALDNSNFIKWGQHYLPSLGCAHLLQICNNFKDPGIQVYLSDDVGKIIAKHDSIFNSIFHQTVRAGSTEVKIYNSSGNPCFSGCSKVRKMDGSLIRVDEIKKGDFVLMDPSSNECAQILCVLKTITNGTVLLVNLGSGLKITPYHPVFADHQWKFPIEFAFPSYQRCEAIYSFVLNTIYSGDNSNHRHTVVIGGIPCATLGHSLKGNVIEHEYLGTERVLEDMKELKGWNDGLVVVSGTIKGSNGNVCGLVPFEYTNDTVATAFSSYQYLQS